MIACAALALLITGGWDLGLRQHDSDTQRGLEIEGTKWQLSERRGLVVLCFPCLYSTLIGKYSKASTRRTSRHDGRERVGASHLFLCCIKLLQVKSDRDWLVHYLVTFFQILLAAGLSISPMSSHGARLYVFCSC